MYDYQYAAPRRSTDKTLELIRWKKELQKEVNEINDISV